MRKLLWLALLPVSVWAQAANYIGVDYFYWWLHGRDANNYAMRLALPSGYNNYEVYAAHRFENDVGLSIGWQQSNTKHINHAFSQNETFLGAPENAGDSVSTSSQMRAINFDLNGYLNLTEKFEAIGQLGIALMESDITGTLYTSGVASNLAPSHNYRPVPRIGFALQYLFFCKLGFRVIGHWVGTNMFHQKFTDSDGIRRNIKPFKQSWDLGAGLVCKF